MDKYVQLELFDLSMYSSICGGLQKDNLILFKTPTKPSYKQLELDLGLEKNQDVQFSDHPEVA